jgi:hypothetical protein
MVYQIAQPVAGRALSLRAGAGRDGKGTPDKRPTYSRILELSDS